MQKKKTEVLKNLLCTEYFFLRYKKSECLDKKDTNRLCFGDILQQKWRYSIKVLQFSKKLFKIENELFIYCKDKKCLVYCICLKIFCIHILYCHGYPIANICVAILISPIFVLFRYLYRRHAPQIQCPDILQVHKIRPFCK